MTRQARAAIAPNERNFLNTLIERHGRSVTGQGETDQERETQKSRKTRLQNVKTQKPRSVKNVFWPCAVDRYLLKYRVIGVESEREDQSGRCGLRFVSLAVSLLRESACGMSACGFLTNSCFPTHRGTTMCRSRHRAQGIADAVRFVRQRASQVQSAYLNTPHGSYKRERKDETEMFNYSIPCTPCTGCIRRWRSGAGR